MTDTVEKQLGDAVAILRWMDEHFADQDVTHRAFREHAGMKAVAFISRIDREADLLAEIDRASQPHAPEVPGEIAEGEDE